VVSCDKFRRQGLVMRQTCLGGAEPTIKSSVHRLRLTGWDANHSVWALHRLNAGLPSLAGQEIGEATPLAQVQEKDYKSTSVTGERMPIRETVLSSTLDGRMSGRYLVPLHFSSLIKSKLIFVVYTRLS
jgi:hypothetical protein